MNCDIDTELYDLLSDGVKCISHGHYTVKSQNTDCDYDVWTRCTPWVCTCLDYKFHKHVAGYACKHMMAVCMTGAVRFTPPIEPDQTADTIINEVDTHQCTRCGQFNTIRHGTRHNRNYTVERRLCKSCGKTYSCNIGFESLSHSPDVVTDALNMYDNGASSHGVVSTLEERGIKISHQTVLGWVRNLGRKAYEYASTLTPRVGKAWRTDEMHIKVKGDESYLYCMMDDRTRFWLTYMVAPNKGTDDVRPMFVDASRMAGSNPILFISDGAHNFAEAASIEYPEAAHVRHIHIQGDRNNNKMERFIGRIRSREKTMRSLKRLDSGAIPSMWVHYNFVRRHMGLDGKTPAHAAGILVKGISKWRTLIQNATRAKYSALWAAHAA